MKKEIRKISTISEFHAQRKLSTKAAHPLISLVDYAEVAHSREENHIHWVQGFYTIGLKRNVVAKLRYGQKEYDFDEGIMTFLAPGQVLNVVMEEQEIQSPPTGWLLLIHPDFLWNTALLAKMKSYDFFDYSLHEALFLSGKEEETLLRLFDNIQDELTGNIDDFSQNIILSQIELMLNYAERFYKRQFTTRKKNNHEVLARLETYLNAYFEEGNLSEKGLPTVQKVADHLHFSVSYLSNLLKSHTGLSTQQHIHEKLIAHAKERLSTTTESISEIAFHLGFEHVQSFSKLFKNKTRQTPLEFREKFN